MFPTNLHKNIVQLDRQISLLENECKNMEVDRRKKSFKPEPAYGKCSKLSTSQLKASPIKVTLKTNGCLKRNKKLTRVSGRLQSSSPLESQCSQMWSDICETAAGRKAKVCRMNTNISGCSCRKLGGGQYNSRRRNKYLNCDSCNESSILELPKADSVEDQKLDQVLHKELLYSNSGGTIEVTVTQKCGKQNSPIIKTINLENNTPKESCHCQIKGQKWSEILCSDISKKKTINSENFAKNKFTGDETKTINQSLTSNNNSVHEGNKSQENINYSNNSNVSIQEENSEEPIKVFSPSYKIITQPKVNSDKPEKDIQCALENINNKKSETGAKDTIKIIQHFVNQLKQLPINEVKQLSKGVDVAVKKLSCKETLKDLAYYTKKDIPFEDTDFNNTSLEAVKQHCEKLIKENKLLSKELAAKDIIIATLNKREDEYLTVISGLKLNLERTKESAQESTEAIKEVNGLKNKLLEKIKFSETVQKNFNKAHDLLEKYILENQKLKTQIKILILEAQKHEVLLAGKEAEVSKYKQEIQNFQRQITDHLAVLKSNAEGIDMEKMIQAIFQQSQIFVQTDLYSVIAENEEKDTSKLQNVLMHSSPTSSKSSIVNSSWKQISSIHEHGSKVNSEVNLNNDNNAKNYFEIFGDNASSVSKSSKKPKETSVEGLLDGKNVKHSLSFTSCISAHDDQNSSSGRSRNGDSLVSNCEPLSNKERAVEEIEKNGRVSFEKAQSNIDEVLKNMKLKFSRKIFETSLTNCTTDDFLNSQISSVSQ